MMSKNLMNVHQPDNAPHILPTVNTSGYSSPKRMTSKKTQSLNYQMSIKAMMHSSFSLLRDEHRNLAAEIPANISK